MRLIIHTKNIVSCVTSPKGETLTKSSSIIHLVDTTTVWFTLVCKSNDETSVKLDELTCYKVTNSLMKDLKTKTRFIIYHLDNQYTRRDQKDLSVSIKNNHTCHFFFEYSKPLKIHTFDWASFNLQLALFRRAMSSSFLPFVGRPFSLRRARSFSTVNDCKSFSPERLLDPSCLDTVAGLLAELLSSRALFAALFLGPSSGVPLELDSPFCFFNKRDLISMFCWFVLISCPSGGDVSCSHT